MTTRYLNIKFSTKKNSKLQVLKVKESLRDFDLESCKIIAQWLSNHIKLLQADEKAFKITLEDMGLSNRAYNVIKKNGIDTIHQLHKLSLNEDNIKVLVGAGPLVSAEILRTMRALQNKYILKEVR
ncbi:hypothetical protein A4H97_29835 [Niastella yeongjuensis]|uniref:RNA polymerase alpha subunit C-terminal domain-containing protein n=1 Tax=Niastella yeongjuensis TaxID=354355 RepID=A0A1V9EPI0_9BACT|nr:DNA-directed RNA polymerase subunit alpha C-terminal domain-containing protein [Niastella yeongjuensis]OQP48040.1 hypothetical protein A4H97_29835 [Niastella yeongjuensis]SEO24474.1 RNA polymerase, alpha chain C terminal domain [Niastella yeongjuensis]